MRRLPSLAREAGFEQVRTRSHGYLDTDGGAYMLSVIDRGVDVLFASGELSTESADELKAEARRRARTGSFFA